MNGLADRIRELMDSFKIKEGYHSNQDCIFGTIKRSEFYGFVLGYAFGTIYRGLFDVSDNMMPVILAALGFLIGIWYDRKFCIVPDDPPPTDDADSIDGSDEPDVLDGSDGSDGSDSLDGSAETVGSDSFDGSDGPVPGASEKE